MVMNIYDVTKRAHIADKYVIPYGLDKCKIDLSINDEIKNNKKNYCKNQKA